MQAEHDHSSPDAECFICRNNFDFQMPRGIVDACADGRLAVFAGAGISTETPAVLQQSFFEGIAASLGGARSEETFPDLMTRFVELESRRLLLRRIQERLNYVNGFPELRQVATRFHRELGSLYTVRDLITTNWDTYFEEVTGALPLVTDKDFALWDMPGRRVVKIHGSISNLGSIVATSQDYDRCYRSLNRNVLGATLKHLLATKTVVFVGYSFRDSDFNRIYGFMRRNMADLLPNAYIVTLDAFRPAFVPGGHVIRTDASFFVQKLKLELSERGCLLPDERWTDIPSALVDLRRRHDELYDAVDLKKVPAAVFCGHYQDGLIHAFERMLKNRFTGEYSHIHAVADQISLYEDIRKERVRGREYHDAAYVEGYQNGLLYLISDDADRKFLPRYFVYGSKVELRSLTAFRREARIAENLHKTAFAQARRIAERWSPGIVPHHLPELL